MCRRSGEGGITVATFGDLEYRVRSATDVHTLAGIVEDLVKRTKREIEEVKRELAATRQLAEKKIK
jgi:hypothetical protein